MLIDYKPLKLKEWVKKEVNTDLVKQVSEDPSRQLRINRLRDELILHRDNSRSEFNKWADQLVKREILLLPYLLDDAKHEWQTKKLASLMYKTAKIRRGMFRNCLQACYQSNQFGVSWKVAQKSYSYHHVRLKRRWNSDQADLWGKFIQVKEQQDFSLSAIIIDSDRRIEEICEELFIPMTSPFYQEVIVTLFENGNIDFFFREQERFIKMLKLVTSEKRIRILTGFLKAHMKNKDFDYNKKISLAIYEQMATVKRKPQKWTGIDRKLALRFQRWINHRNIKTFFGEINQNHERFVYWEKFIPKLEDAIVLPDSATILFYFEDVVIMEILNTGAVYVYRLAYFNDRWGPKIDEFLEWEERKTHSWANNPTRLTRSMLMEKEEVVPGGWLSHSGSWQDKFDNFLLNRLHWKVTRDEILQESESRTLQ